MLSTAFRKYDIRGIVGSEILIEDIKPCIVALCYYFKKNFETIDTICIGRDGRLHSEKICSIIVETLLGQGFNVVDLGLVPTPVHAFAQHALRIAAGLMITASHNAGHYNGIKITVNNKPLFDKPIQSIKHLFQARIQDRNLTSGIYSTYDISDEYLSFIEKNFPHLKNIQMSIIIDAGNGATADIIQKLATRMAWQAKIMNATIDGTFPSHDPDPTKKNNVFQLIHSCKKESSLGIAFDGDGDRVVAVTESGIHLVGDDLSGIFCMEIAKKHPQANVVVDVKCSNTIVSWLKAMGLKVIQTPCGHGYIVEAMKKHNAVFGGELSCHFCFSDDYLGIDDGIYGACRIIELCINNEKKLDELANLLPTRYLSSEMRIPCPENLKDKTLEHLIRYTREKTTYTISTLDGILAFNQLAATSIRKSNTESVLSVRFEGVTKAHLTAIMTEYYSEILKYLPEQTIKHIFESSI